jgi:glycerophosphoryl diester phosphodiesterase
MTAAALTRALDPAAPGSATLVVAHRGASEGLVGNSLTAFERAVALGADMIELDVRRTRDGKLIAFHDALVDGQPVGSLTRAEIAGATGHKPPRLAEVLELAAGRIGLDVELKEGGYVEAVLALLRPAIAAGDSVLTSFLDDVVAEVKQRAPEALAGLLLGVARPRPWLRTRVSEIDPVPRARACGADFVAPHVAIARLGAVVRARDAGLPAFVWTVNDERTMGRLFAERHVAALITDRPERARALRKESAS